LICRAGRYEDAIDIVEIAAAAALPGLFGGGFCLNFGFLVGNRTLHFWLVRRNGLFWRGRLSGNYSSKAKDSSENPDDFFQRTTPD